MSPLFYPAPHPIRLIAHSGTTIIAAERQARHCFAVEISPAYCDVAVTRWEQYTGSNAERKATSGNT